MRLILQKTLYPIGQLGGFFELGLSVIFKINQKNCLVKRGLRLPR